MGTLQATRDYIFAKSENQTKEIWVDIKGYEGLYQISNYGRVKNKHLRILVTNYDKDGYKRITLTKYENGIKVLKTFLIHKLVALHFVRNPNGYKLVNHKDEYKENNFYKNLEWCTRKYNNNYGSKKDFFKKSRPKRSVIDLTKNIIYSSMQKAGKAGGVSGGAIYNCCTGRNKTSYGHEFMFYDEYINQNFKFRGQIK